MADIAKRKEAEREKERELEKVRAERRKRYYDQAPLISLTIPKNSSLLKKDEDV